MLIDAMKITHGVEIEWWPIDSTWMPLSIEKDTLSELNDKYNWFSPEYYKWNPKSNEPAALEIKSSRPFLDVEDWIRQVWNNVVKLSKILKKIDPNFFDIVFDSSYPHGVFQWTDFYKEIWMHITLWLEWIITSHWAERLNDIAFIQELPLAMHFRMKSYFDKFCPSNRILNLYESWRWNIKYLLINKKNQSVNKHWLPVFRMDSGTNVRMEITTPDVKPWWEWIRQWINFFRDEILYLMNALKDWEINTSWIFESGVIEENFQYLQSRNIMSGD